MVNRYSFGLILLIVPLRLLSRELRRLLMRELTIIATCHALTILGIFGKFIFDIFPFSL